MKTLLIGMGNPILCDDAVGIRIAHYIRERIGRVDGLTIFEECSAGGLNILEIIAGFDRLIILDSIKTGISPPGCWYRFTAGSLKETMNLNNIHDINFATALTLGRSLRIHLPEDKNIHIFTVEVLDNLTFSEQMTEPLEMTFNKFADEIFFEIKEILESDFLTVHPN